MYWQYSYLFDSISNNSIYFSKFPITSEQFYLTIRITTDKETKTKNADYNVHKDTMNMYCTVYIIYLLWFNFILGLKGTSGLETNCPKLSKIVSKL